MAPKSIVLIAGISGMMGTKIASAILEKGVMSVRGLVRSTSSNNKKQQFAHLKANGVELVEGDLFDPSSLTKACEGVEVIVSAVKGNVSKKNEFVP